jgi:uncharacterized protein YbaR (Trm112 family)
MTALPASMCIVRGPCGHETDFDAACIKRDEFVCPVCRAWWTIRQDPPYVLKSGFVVPGKRHVHLVGH